jgi:hypothetical protein
LRQPRKGKAALIGDFIDTEKKSSKYKERFYSALRLLIAPNVEAEQNKRRRGLLGYSK